MPHTHENVKTLTIDELFSDLFHGLLKKNKISPTDFETLIDRWVDTYVSKGQRAMERANWRRRLQARSFSHRVFIVGLQMIGIEDFDVELHLGYHFKNASATAKGTGIDAFARYNLADI